MEAGLFPPTLFTWINPIIQLIFVQYSLCAWLHDGLAKPLGLSELLKIPAPGGETQSRHFQPLGRLRQNDQLMDLSSDQPGQYNEICL